MSAKLARAVEKSCGFDFGLISNGDLNVSCENGFARHHRQAGGGVCDSGIGKQHDEEVARL